MVLAFPEPAALAHHRILASHSCAALVASCAAIGEAVGTLYQMDEEAHKSAHKAFYGGMPIRCRNFDELGEPNELPKQKLFATHCRITQAVRFQMLKAQSPLLL